MLKQTKLSISYNSDSSDDIYSNDDTSSNISNEEPVIIPINKNVKNELEFQKILMTDILISMGKKNKTIRKIFQLYESMYDRVLQLDKNFIWKMISLEFSGIISYGSEISKFDFRNRPVIGIQGNNSSGKSSIIDIIQFILFGETNRFGSQIFDLVNKSTKKCYCKAVVRYDNSGYIFEINCSVSKNNIISFERITRSCDLDINDNIIKGSIKDIRPNYLFGSFDIFNIMYSIQLGMYPTSTYKFTNMEFDEQQSILDQLLNNDVLVRCLRLLCMEQMNDKMKNVFQNLYTNIISSEMIIKYLIPKVVYRINKILEKITDFTIIPYESQDGCIFFEGCSEKFKRPHNPLGKYELSRNESSLLNSVIAVSFRLLRNDNKCGLFVFDEFIDYPEDDTIVITKKLLRYMKKYYNNICLMSVHGNAIEKTCGNIFRINSEKYAQSKLFVK